MDSDPGSSGSTHLTWANVGLAFAFILLDAILSTAFGLGVGSSLVTAAIRCVVQLSVVALILRQVFETNNPWAVAGMACLLNFMGTAETGELLLRRRRRVCPSHDYLLSKSSTNPRSAMTTWSATTGQLLRCFHLPLLTGPSFQFPSVLFGMLGSTIPVSIIGIRFAMGADPFWKPDQYSA